MKLLVSITLSWRIPSKKNSKIWTWRTLISSKEYREREQKKIDEIKQRVEPMKLNEQLRIEYEFYMPDKRKSDLSNKVESINDMLVKYWLLEDDNWTVIRELKVSCMWVDRNNPRCVINIYSLND